MSIGGARPNQSGEGPIPACAGETPSLTCYFRTRQVHPRLCGGNIAAILPPAETTGPSPPVRGKLCGPGKCSYQRGSIPACAGETPRLPRRHSLPVRSIPACAGETVQSGCARSWARVHPRLCGGNAWSASRVGLMRGPSPPVRGKPEPCPSGDTWLRSIPACAGETPCIDSERRFAQVHPRLCGGNRITILPPDAAHGPSPPVRGKRPKGVRRSTRSGSIPACAGETSTHAPVEERVHARPVRGNCYKSHGPLA